MLLADLNVSREDLETISLLASPIVGLAGVLLGSRLHRRATLEATREEREHASRQEVQRRKEEAAGRLDEAVQAAQEEIPYDVTAGEAAPQMSSMQMQLRQALARNPVLDDAEVDRRFWALDITLVLASSTKRLEGGEWTDPNLNLFPVMVAMRELRKALTYFQRREPPPPTPYPSVKELRQIVFRQGGGNFNAINDWLIENEVG